MNDWWKIPGLSIYAFVAVWRRAIKNDFPAVVYDAQSIWWTAEESFDRNRRAWDQINAGVEREELNEPLQ